MKPIISIQNLKFKFDNNNLFENFSLTINKGEKVGICGKNGSGKSTLLRLMLKIYQSNSVILNEKIKICQILNPNVGLNVHLTVLENIKRISYLMNTTIQIDDKLNQIIDLVNLQPYINQRTSALSQGYKLRIFFVLFFYENFDLIVMDEYVSFGDGELSNKIKHQFDDKLRNSTLVLASHNDKFLKTFCDKVIYL